MIDKKMADYILMHFPLKTQCAFKDAGYKYDQFDDPQKMIEKLREIKKGGKNEISYIF